MAEVPHHTQVSRYEQRRVYKEGCIEKDVFSSRLSIKEKILQEYRVWRANRIDEVRTELHKNNTLFYGS